MSIKIKKIKKEIEQITKDYGESTCYRKKVWEIKLLEAN